MGIPQVALFDVGNGFHLRIVFVYQLTGGLHTAFGLFKSGVVKLNDVVLDRLIVVIEPLDGLNIPREFCHFIFATAADETQKKCTNDEFACHDQPPRLRFLY